MRRTHQALLTGSVTTLIAALASAQKTSIVSVTSMGVLENGDASSFEVSDDGRWVAFTSNASNLVLGDSNNISDVFLNDRLSGATQRVSVATGGGQAGGYSDSPSISADGHFVAFASDASGLVANDTNGASDVFVRDLVTGTTTRVSVTSTDLQVFGSASSPSISGDGRFVVFDSGASGYVAGDTNGMVDVFLRDRTLGTTTRISIGAGGVQGNGASYSARISPDGGFVVFASDATNLGPGDINGATDVFLYEASSGLVTPVTVDPNSLIGNGYSTSPDVSANATFVVFHSTATNFVLGDNNGATDVYLWRRLTGVFSRQSVNSSGQESFGGSYNPRISADGTVVVFYSDASSLVAGDTNNAYDVFRHYRTTGLTERVSVGDLGVQGNGQSYGCSVSSNGATVAFGSNATNLVAGDVNGRQDVFAYAPPFSDQIVYCTAKTNSNGCVPTICSTGEPTLSAPDDFVICAYRLLNLKSGLFFWGNAAFAAPFGGGTRCVQYPVVRTPIQNSGGSPAVNDCTGSYNYPFTDAYMQLHGLAAGTHVFGQYWSRDPFFPIPNNIGLTDAIEFVVVP